MKTLALFAVVLVAACTPSTVTPPPDADASPTPACVAACANLYALGCPEGETDAGCAAACTHVSSTGLTDLHVACVTSATTRVAVRACGSVICDAGPE